MISGSGALDDLACFLMSGLRPVAAAVDFESVLTWPKQGSSLCSHDSIGCLK